MDARESDTSDLVGALDAIADQYGERIALIDENDSVTFDQLAQRSACVARGLADLGIRRGDVVAVWLPNRIEWLELVFATARLGALVLGINTRYRSHELVHALKVSGASALVFEPGFSRADCVSVLSEAITELPVSLRHIIEVSSAGAGRNASGQSQLLAPGLKTHSYSSLFLSTGKIPAPVAGARLRSSAFSSSGTTGPPKLVTHTQFALVSHSRAIAGAFGYGECNTAVLTALPICGVFGFNTVLAALCAGARAVLVPVFDAEVVTSLMREHSVTHANLSDEMLVRILSIDGVLDTLPQWQECGFGAFTAADPRRLVDSGDAAGKKFFQTFGSSEVQALMTYPAPDADAERRSKGGGVPVSGDIEVRIMGTDNRPVPPGEVGEISVKGPNVTAGYLGVEGIDNLSSDGFFRTGDVGLSYVGRDFVYLFRSGDALRLAGFLVDPREIEEFLEAQKGVEQAQVVGIEVNGRTVPVAFVIPTSTASLIAEQLDSVAKHYLASFKVPWAIEVLEEFPMVKGANGVKIQRSDLRRRAEGIRDKWTAERGIQ